MNSWLVIWGAMLVFQETMSLHIPEGQVEVIQMSEESNGHLSFDRVELGGNSTLRFPPFKSLRIQSLISKPGAKIHFAAQWSGVDAEANTGASGGDGASAPVFIKNIEGDVLIEARGGDGAKGRDGRHGRPGSKGAKGRDARTLIFGLFYLEDGEDGYSGVAGENGEDGANGGDGGRGGNVRLYFVRKSQSANIVIDTSGGHGGDGGRAGWGGLGGPGGDGGRGIKTGRQGPKGIDGISGQAGRPGSPGATGSSAIYQVSGPLYECLFWLVLRSDFEELEEDDFDECAEIQTPTKARAFIPTQKPHPIFPPSPDGKGESLEEMAPALISLSADGKNGLSAYRSTVSGQSPSNASHGASGGAITVVLSQLPEFVEISARGGDGGNGGRGSSGNPGADGYDGVDAALFRKATAGQDGQNGGNATNGSNGGDGGNGGRVKVVLITGTEEEENPNLDDPEWMNRVRVDVSGGQSGRGAAGGMAGRGGRGGRGGKKFLSKEHLPDGRDGRSGREGSFGADGIPGAEGQVEFFEADRLEDWILHDLRDFLDTHQ